MVSGRENLEVINQYISQAQNAQGEAGRRLEDLHRQLEGLRLELNGSYRQLARLRLDDLQASEAMARLNETDQAILMLVANLKQARRGQQEALAASLAAREQLEAERKELARQRDEAGAALEQQLAETQKRLSATEAYRQQQEKARQAGAVAAQAEDKAARAEQDRLEKGKPYEADRLFMYLWERRFLTPEYRGGWLTRPLDHWVAQIIDYPRNRANYHMLLELPRRLREHAARVRQTAQSEAQALQQTARQAAEADGALALQARVQAAEQKLTEMDARIDTAAARHQELTAEGIGYNTGTDDLSKQIIEIQTAALEKEPLAGLLEKARATPRPEDDALVARIGQLRERQQQISEEIQSLNTKVAQEQRQLGELEEVRRRYRQQGYDRYNSQFPGDFALAVLLGRMLDGLANPDTVWGEIDRHQHRRGPSGGWGGGGGEPGGSFGGGGGDFYTDDSF